MRSTALTSVKCSVPTVLKQQQHADDEAGIAHAIDDECLLARVAGRLLVEVEADQQVAAQSHAFPADEQQHVVVRQHQHQHEEDEQIEVAEEAVVAVVVRHVAGGVDVDQETDAGDDQDHHRAERIEQEAPVHWNVAIWPLAMWNGSPAIQVNWTTSWTRSGLLRKLPHRARGEDEGEQDHARADQIDQELQRRVVMMPVPMIVRRGRDHDRDRGRDRDRDRACGRDRDASWP